MDATYMCALYIYREINVTQTGTYTYNDNFSRATGSATVS